MALTTYTELKAKISEVLNRDDLTDAQAADFIALAESRFRRDIRHWRMIRRATGTQTAGSQFMALPDDWIETIRLNIATYGTVNVASLDTIADHRAKHSDGSTANVYLYAHVGSEYELYPTPSEDTDFELVYYENIPALSASVASNWLLDHYPDVYLYGALVHTAPWLQEDERLATWGQLYTQAMADLNADSEAARHSGTGLRMKIRGMG